MAEDCNDARVYTVNQLMVIPVEFLTEVALVLGEIRNARIVIHVLNLYLITWTSIRHKKIIEN
jgi:hypothetical protein